AINAPTDISGLVAWHDASTLALADEAPVAAWPTAGGPASTLAQNTSSKRPPFIAGASPNGSPAVRFNGAGHVLTSTLPAPNTPVFTLFYVGSLVGEAGGVMLDGTSSTRRFALGSTTSGSSDLVVWTNLHEKTVSWTGNRPYPYGIFTINGGEASST